MIPHDERGEWERFDRQIRRTGTYVVGLAFGIGLAGLAAAVLAVVILA